MIWEAPSKVNLSLEVRSRTRDGMHPLRSLVQAIEWCDALEFEEDDQDHLEITGAELPDDGDNLIWKALTGLRRNLATISPAFTSG